MELRDRISPTLRRILKDTEREIAADQTRETLEQLRRAVRDAPPVRSFSRALAPGPSLIAELKERSPSQGEMRTENVAEAPEAYKGSPLVKAISVLTCPTHFGAGMRVERLRALRDFTGKPVLRKDFIVEDYQVYQARAYGADAILLMANVLPAGPLERLSTLAGELGMEVLFETHCREELEDLPLTAHIVGINCRNFEGGRFSLQGFGVARLLRQRFGVQKDHSVDLSRFDYATHLPSRVLKVAESGVTPENCAGVFSRGFEAALVGTSLLMDPRGVRTALAEFEAALNPEGNQHMVRQPAGEESYE